MKIGDILYFAPKIRFGEVDLNGPRLPEQFKCRMAGLYVTPAEQCARGGHAFAAGVLLVSCIDALARLRFGGGVGQRLKSSLARSSKASQMTTWPSAFTTSFATGWCTKPG